MAKRRTDNTMVKRRTDNTMAKRRTDNTIARRKKGQNDKKSSQKSKDCATQILLKTGDELRKG